MIYFFLESSSTFVDDISNYIEINKIIYLSMIREKKHNKMSCIEWDDSFKNDKVIFEQSQLNDNVDATYFYFHKNTT